MASSKIRAQFATMLGSRITANLLQAVNVIVLARSVNPSEIGVTSAIIGVCMVLFTVTDLGVSTYTMKAHAQREERAVASALRVTTFTTWFFGLLALAGSVGLSGAGVIPLTLTPLVLSVAIDRCVEFRLGVPIAEDSLSIPASSILLRRFIQFAIFLILIPMSVTPLLAYSLAQLLGALAGYAQSRFFLRRSVHYAGHDFKSPFAILRESFHYFVSNVTTQIQLLDTFLVSACSGAKQAGLYAAAMRVTSPLVLIPGTLASAVLPPAARATPRQARSIALKLMALVPPVLLISIPGGFLLARPVCVLLYGEAYRDAALTLAIMLQGIPFAILAAAVAAVLQAQGEDRFVAKTGLVFALIFIAAVSGGALWYGSVGAAIGSALTAVCKCIPLGIRANRMGHGPHGPNRPEVEAVGSPHRTIDSPPATIQDDGDGGTRHES
ncbi:lipopolysaccharide biosynthesis protein [Tsukamurella sp. 8J]|uniref:lipopolysaccharide biosynthesis protein n=2 Tax=unclassified Tsukamurella TaxID=2633480 RepID=UPI0023B8BD96|nr:lipopolysaccharide biosynthesis protein [Tsukamurella sp. 8J]MDF0530642.1 lipopolysaccharide biosynthesis protein [Tsukamurella sp. 8J]